MPTSFKGMSVDFFMMQLAYTRQGTTLALELLDFWLHVNLLGVIVQGGATLLDSISTVHAYIAN